MGGRHACRWVRRWLPLTAQFWVAQLALYNGIALAEKLSVSALMMADFWQTVGIAPHLS
jgi:hypothetical protein